jgi:DNA-binding NtrC family response regulator
MHAMSGVALRILVVDDEPAVLAAAVIALEPPHCVHTCDAPQAAIELIARENFDLVVTDLRMPGVDGTQIIRAAVGGERPIPVIVLTAVDHARSAIEAMALGASDYLVKPVEPGQLRAAIERIPTPSGEAGTRTYGLIGASPQITQIRRLVPLLAGSRENLLILGETGTGKDLLARAVHGNGPRAAGAFVAHNMAATPGELAESVFFGHARGAFSGATGDHPGLFEQADGGTLFLDEIDSFPLPLQAKLLRVLEAGRAQRIGSVQQRPFDVRLIAASSVDLGELVARSAFRADLYYRLHQLEIRMPPLRERRADVPGLIEQFLDELAAETGRRPAITRAAHDRLAEHPWPGNCRELRSAIRSAALLAGLGPVNPGHLPSALRNETAGTQAASLREAERDHIRDVLAGAKGNQSRAARLLGIDRGTLARKLRPPDRGTF